MSIVPAIKSEIAALEADLTANPDPRVRKLARLRETLSEYEPAANSPPVHGNGKMPSPAPPFPWTGLTAETKVARMTGYIKGAIRKNGKVHRKVLLEGLIAAGIMGKEKNPMQALAIFLSGNSEVYESDGSGNYSLREG